MHQCVLAYASDFTLLDTALIAHGKLMFDKDIQLASLDHALWLHRPFRADDWLLYAQDSPPATARAGSAGAASSPAKGAWWRRGPGRPDARTGDRISCLDDGQKFVHAQISCLFISADARQTAQIAKFRIAFQ